MKKKLRELNVDEELVKLREIRQSTVFKYQENYQAGAIFPPLIIQKGTNIIVSGNHRYYAMMEVFGELHHIEVIEREYESRKSLIADFAAENMKHGLELNSVSRRLIALKLKSEGATSEEIAGVFEVPAKRIIEWCEQPLFVIGSKEKSGSPVPAKPVEKEQEYFKTRKPPVRNSEDLGISVKRDARRIIDFINKDQVKSWDFESVNALKELRKSIDRFLKEIS